MWDWFINFLTMVLEGLHGVSGDWGLAVIILTLIIRLILTPLQTKSVKSTAKHAGPCSPRSRRSRRVRGRPRPHAGGADEALLRGKLQPDHGLPASLPADAYLLCPLHRREERACGCLLLRYSAVHLRFRRWRACRSGWAAAAPYIIFDLLFGVLTFVPMLMNTQMQGDQRMQSITMGAVMSIMMLWFGWSCPAASFSTT